MLENAVVACEPAMLAMAMVMYELFDYIERHTTGWAHRGSQNT